MRPLGWAQLQGEESAHRSYCHHGQSSPLPGKTRSKQGKAPCVPKASSELLESCCDSAGTKEQNASVGGMTPNIYSQVAGRSEVQICFLSWPSSLTEDRTMVPCVNLGSAEKVSLITLKACPLVPSNPTDPGTQSLQRLFKEP